MTKAEAVAELIRIWHSPHLDLILKARLGEVIEALSAEAVQGWIPVGDIRKLQDILYLHIDSLEGTRNIVEAGILSAWKEVAEYLDGMLREDGEA